MDLILVIENPRNWDFHIPGVTVVAARDYLTEPRWASETRLNVFNLCRTYSYQTVGYYVSKWSVLARPHAAETAAAERAAAPRPAARNRRARGESV